jgi:drug/metabolite transporter (DMT)-like permease
MWHQASGRWKYGLLLALITAACWATLPVALKLSLVVVDPITLTWFRFGFAAVIMLLWLAGKRQLQPIARLPKKQHAMLLAATVLLLGNYVGYIYGVQLTTPGNAQLLIQLAPLLMALGGVLIFKERFVWGQWLGLVVIVLGLGMFFADQLRTDIGHSPYRLGSAIVILAAVSWAAYALIQKQLLLQLNSQQVLCVIYVVSALLLWPFAQPSLLMNLDALHWGLLLFCALNTLVAYGAFAEALQHWQASRVSAVLATTPLLCLLAVGAVHALWPQAIAAEQVGAIGLIGAGLVVLGSALSSLLGPSAQKIAMPPSVQKQPL